MDDKKEWLEKVLDDASAEVKSWPNWLKDREVKCQDDKTDSHRVNGLAKKDKQSKE